MLQFIFVVKATATKQHKSKFCQQILSTEPSFYIYDRPVTGINVICADNLWKKNWFFALL